MAISNESVQQFQDTFLKFLQKLNCFTIKELQGLWAICATIIGSPAFSLSTVEKNYGKELGRNFLSKILQKYAAVQEQVLHAYVNEICQTLAPGQKVYLLVDDTLVRKRGRYIFGSLRWFDHTIGRKITGLCLVTLALVVENHLVLVMPFLLFEQPLTDAKGSSKSKEQDKKTEVAIKMLHQVIDWCLANGIPENRIVMEMDSWFSSRPMLDFARKSKVLFRIDSKMSYTVRVPDTQAIQKVKSIYCNDDFYHR